MPYLIRSATGTRSVNIDANSTPVVGRGGAGIVYIDPGSPDSVIKLYHSNQIAAHQAKICAMLTNPPDGQFFIHENKRIVQLAWPQGLIETTNGAVVGYSMPLVPSNTVPLDLLLQRSSRKSSGLRDDIELRITVARNLAAVVRELHKKLHYVIDLHSANVRIYPSTGYVCLLDSDGYSVASKSGPRFPATLVLQEVLGPDGFGKKVETLSEDQDRFALALMVFRLLNEGLTPYQGVGDNTVPPSIVERTAQGLYCYGLTENSRQRPSPQSIHLWLEDDTRQLFDRAFMTGSRSGPRPSSKEWRDHLINLVSRIEICNRNTSHHHFSKGCMWCAKASLRPGQPLPPPPAPRSHPRLPAGKANVTQQPAPPDWLHAALAVKLGVPLSSTVPLPDNSPSATPTASSDIDLANGIAAILARKS